MPLITGVVHKADGSVAARITAKVVRFVPADGSAVSTTDISFYTDADGVIKSRVGGVEQDGFTLLPGTAFISAPIEGFADVSDGKALKYGRAVTIPDEEEINFNDLVPALSATVNGVTSGQLATETAARIAGDAELQEQIDSLGDTYATDAQLTAEATTRAAADATLTAAVSAEATARAAADTTLTAAVTAEASARAAADLLLAPLASPALTGTPTAPTAATPTNTTQLATTAFVQAVAAGLMTAILGAPPEVLDQIEKLADAIGDDPNFSVTMAAALALKAPLASPTFTGTVSGITKAMVGLGNVDNTSDATKNAAAATLTNKTLTAPVINSPTGLVKGDVGLGSVDNTADSAKPVSTAQAAADAGVLASANAYTDAAVAGGTGEQLVNSATIDLNDTSPQVVYTVPVGKKFILTRTILSDLTQAGEDGASTSLAVTGGGGIALGSLDSMTALQFNHGTQGNVRAIAAAAGSDVTATVSGAYGSANPATLDVYGILKNA